jgi:hypothetical protein
MFLPTVGLSAPHGTGLNIPCGSYLIRSILSAVHHLTDEIATYMRRL